MKAPIRNMSMLALHRRLKMDHITVHGFRSSFRDWAAEETSFPSEVAEMALAHVIENRMEAAYRLGDRMLMESDLDWVILRPTLVIGAQAYGGTALLRASAGVPLVAVKVLPTTPVQTVFVDDVAHAVVQAASLLRADVNGDGVLTQEEFLVQGAPGDGSALGEFAALIEHADEDRDGVLGLDEMLASAGWSAARWRARRSP